MEWLKEMIRNNPLKSLFLPTALGGFTFFINLFNALRDGVIDDKEFHSLLSSASGLETFILVLIMAALKGTTSKKQDDNE